MLNSASNVFSDLKSRAKKFFKNDHNKKESNFSEIEQIDQLYVQSYTETVNSMNNRDSRQVSQILTPEEFHPWGIPLASEQRKAVIKITIRDQKEKREQIQCDDQTSYSSVRVQHAYDSNIRFRFDEANGDGMIGTVQGQNLQNAIAVNVSDVQVPHVNNTNTTTSVCRKILEAFSAIPIFFKIKKEKQIQDQNQKDESDNRQNKDKEAEQDLEFQYIEENARGSGSNAQNSSQSRQGSDHDTQKEKKQDAQNSGGFFNHYTDDNE